MKLLNYTSSAFTTIMRRRLIEVRRSLSDNMIAFVQSLVLVFSLLLMARWYSLSHLEVTIGTESFYSYILLGATLIPLSAIAIWNAVEDVSRDIDSGMFRVVLAESPHPFMFYFISGATSFVQVAIYFIPILGCALAMGWHELTVLRLFYGLAAYLLLFITLASMGTLCVMLRCAFRSTLKAFPIVHVGLQFLTGAFIPVQVFPLPELSIPLVTWLVPGTIQIDLVRVALLGAKPLFPISSALIISAVHVFFFLVSAAAIMPLVRRRLLLSGGDS